jgi:hypothetical protein
MQSLEPQRQPDHPEQELPSAEVVRRGWIINAPRLRDRLERLLDG